MLDVTPLWKSTFTVNSCDDRKLQSSGQEGTGILSRLHDSLRFWGCIVFGVLCKERSHKYL